MFKMIEATGSSEKGFSEAVQDALTRGIPSGQKAHFFEVIEQRGAIASGKLATFEVKLKIALEEAEEEPAEKEHFCPTCHQHVSEHGHMCVPLSHEDQTCEWCGALIPNQRHLCNEKIKDISYICNSCGRTAVKAEYLCNPVKIEDKG